jgi:hypothetical protein
MLETLLIVGGFTQAGVVCYVHHHLNRSWWLRYRANAGLRKLEQVNLLAKMPDSRLIPEAIEMHYHWRVRTKDAPVAALGWPDFMDEGKRMYELRYWVAIADGGTPYYASQIAGGSHDYFHLKYGAISPCDNRHQATLYAPIGGQ